MAVVGGDDPEPALCGARAAQDTELTVTAVLTLAPGIGVNAALFSVYDIVALRPLPSRQPYDLVEIRGRNVQAKGGVDLRFSYPDYLDYCAGSGAFSDLVAVTSVTAQLP